MVKTFCCFFIFYLVISRACAQDEPGAGFCIEVNPFEGNVLRHEAKFTLPLPKLTSGLDINLQQKTYGKKDWQQRRRYPAIGIGFTYTDYGIDAVYGRCYSIYPNLEIPLVKGNRVEWTMRIGDGIGYVTRAFSRESPVDTVNVAIGSRLNDYFSFLSDIRCHINKHWDVQAGINFSHISDAAFHQPNLGINLYGAHFGIKYFPVTANPKHIVHELKPLTNRWLFELRATMAFNETGVPQGPLYPAYIATGFVSRRWMSRNKFMAGFDYEYHRSIDASLLNNIGLVIPGTEASRSWRTAVFAGNEFLMGRVGIVLQLGYYTHQAYQVLGVFYEKIGANIYIVKKEQGPVKELFLCAYLKTHQIVAEFAEFGMGIGF